ncbi:MAG: xanthine dehydrogenase family protein molybdopterin-binding subunit [Proteobacteria bacterium]|nr:xanthine dehydrogenase family protein molybdopterin-binding subunit [Pseudomonadota bacterium]
MKRIDAYEKVTGRAIYADDLKLPGMLYAAPLHSGHPSAIIKNIDTSKALAHPGIVDVITAAGVPGSNMVGGIIADQQVIAADRVRYMGDVVAMVAAETPEAAREAAALIKVEYEPLEPILSPAAALEKGADPIHEGRSNVVTAFKVRKGDAAAAIKESKRVVEAEFRTSFIEHAYMEPESCVAVAEPDGSVTVHGGMQHPFTTRRFVSAATGLALSRVRIIQTTLGGGFGGKDDTISIICARAAILALRTKQPVKITYTREESMRESYKRHPMELSYKAGMDAKGKLRAMEVDITADAGPICSSSPFVIWRPTVQCAGPYVVPNVHCDSRAAYTNNTFTGAMRGFGSPQHVFACESFVDMCAEAARLDPYEFRKLNFFKQGSITHTGQKLTGHKVSMAEVAERALEEFGWKRAFEACSRGTPRADGLLYGAGFAASFRGVSLGAEGKDFCAAVVNIQPDGSAVLDVGVSENGQGLKTAMTTILCEELGIAPERVEFVDTDTASIPDSGPTVASRGTIVGGNAVLDACAKIKERMAPVLAELIGASGKGYEFGKGRIRNPSNKKTVPFEDAAAACHERHVFLDALGTWHGPPVSFDEKDGHGDAYFTYVYGCQACDLTVDPKSGRVKVERVVAAHDVGRAINPEMAAGQVFGGVMMGLGFALMEEVRHDRGVIQNTNLNTYRIPRTTDVPEMTAILVENPDPAGPCGAKSLGEPVNELMGAAVANAIYYATGRRIFSLPITPEKVVSALKK